MFASSQSELEAVSLEKNQEESMPLGWGRDFGEKEM